MGSTASELVANTAEKTKQLLSLIFSMSFYLGPGVGYLLVKAIDKKNGGNLGEWGWINFSKNEDEK